MWIARVVVSGRGLTWQESVVYSMVNGLIILASHLFYSFYYISATKKPAQPCNLMRSGACSFVSGLQSWSSSILKSISYPPHPATPIHSTSPILFPFVSAHDTTSLLQLLRFSHIWWKTLQAATSNYHWKRSER